MVLVRREGEKLTNDKGNHGCAISSCGLKAPDQLLDLPYLNVSLRFVRLGRAHLGRGDAISMRRNWIGRTLSVNALKQRRRTLVSLTFTILNEEKKQWSKGYSFQQKNGREQSNVLVGG